MPPTQQTYRPELTNAGLAPTHPVRVVDECNRSRDAEIPGESPLTLYVDGREIVTLMTLGTHPEALALGFLRNQRLVEELEEIVSVEVDWGEEWVRVATRSGGGLRDQEAKLGGRTVTTGCGQGTVFAASQSGRSDLRLANIVSDRESLIAARDDAFALVDADPGLELHLISNRELDPTWQNRDRVIAHHAH